MVDVPSKGAVREVVGYNVNRYTIVLALITVGLWGVGYTESATSAFLILLLVIILQNLWLGYTELDK